MPKERPILFNDEMVRAILNGRKTQMRRPVKLTGKTHSSRLAMLKRDIGWTEIDSHGLPCPLGAPGDLLWVRETWYCDDYRASDKGRLSDPELIPDFLQAMDYRATHECCHWEAGCPCDCDGRSSWRPSTHMPRWASRITLRVTDVRVERVRRTRFFDIRAEGVPPQTPDCPCGANTTAPMICGPCAIAAESAWRDLWDSAYAAKGFGWDVNPWVWAVSFERVNSTSGGE